MAAQHRLAEPLEPPDILTDETLAEVIPLRQACELAEQMASEAESFPDVDRKIEQAKKNSDRNRTITICVVALIAIIAVITAGWNAQRIAENESAVTLNGASIEAYGRAIEELRRAGVPEDQLPPPLPPAGAPADEVDVNAIIQASSAAALVKMRTDPQFRGQAGLPGVNGAPCDPSQNPLCRGPEGAEGVAGQPGTPGTPGTPGAPGDEGTPGTPGEDGIDGTDGKDGDDGADGTPGAPGADAPRPVSAQYVGDLNDCVYRTTYENPDGSTYNVDAPTNGINC